jgi:hypothetical protein
MRHPLDLPGYTLEVVYPSSIYSLERHEIVPYERFAADVFRDSVHELTERHLPPHIIVSFSPIKVDYPEWVINCRVSSDLPSSTLFKIECPQMLPCTLALFSHIVAPHFRAIATSGEMHGNSPNVSASIQRFIDCISAGVRVFKSNGLASAIRKAYDTANLTMGAFQDCVDDFDTLAYLIANHEVAHIYLEQLTGQSNLSQEDRRAFEYLADLVAAEWLFRRYILFTPNDPYYREQLGVSSHAHALAVNSKWAIASLFSLLVLMGVAGAQRSGGRFNFEGGLIHPGAFGRSWLQQAWILGAIDAHVASDIGDELMPSVRSFWKKAFGMIINNGLVTRASMWQAVDENEMQVIQRAAQIAEDRNIEEISPGLEFLRSRIADAQKMRNRLKPE